MKKLFIFLCVASMIGMIGYRILQNRKEGQAHKALIANTSDSANVDRVINIWGDDWLGYMFLRSRYFQKEMEKEKLGLNYSLVFDFEERYRGLAEGKCDIVAGTVDSFLTHAHKEDFPGVIAFVVDESYGGDAVIGGPNVNSLDDLKKANLKGAMVGLSPSEFLLKSQIAHFQIDGMLRRIKNFRRDEAQIAFNELKSGTADFAVLWEPFTSRALTQIPGTKRLIDTSKARGIIIDVAIISRTLVKEHPEIAQKIHNAYFRTLDYYLKHPQLMRDLAQGANPDGKGEIDQMLQGVRFATYQDNREVWFATASQHASPALENGIERIAAILSETGNLSRTDLPRNISTLINSGFNRKAAETNQSFVHSRTTSAQGEALNAKRSYRNLSPDEWQSVAQDATGTLMEEPITFGSGTATIPDEFAEKLSESCDKLTHYPEHRLVINAYVSPGGDADADQKLSADRAKVIRDFLVTRCGVNENRIFAQGLGSTDPPERMDNESLRAWKRRCRRAKIFLATER